MLIANEHFDKLDELSNQDEYECCTFSNCDFGGANFSATKFIESKFIDCNLSNVVVHESSILDVSFESCKMIGIQFDRANHLLFAASFDGCTLDDSTFYDMKLKQCHFQNCSMKGVDFTASDLAGIKLIGCDLLNAVFERANLEGVDFHDSVRLVIDPETARMKKAKLSADQLPGLLTKYNLKIRK